MYKEQNVEHCEHLIYEYCDNKSKSLNQLVHKSEQISLENEQTSQCWNQWYLLQDTIIEYIFVKIELKEWIRY